LDRQKPFFVGRTAAEISEFRGKLLEEFRNSKDIRIPDFKGVKWYESNKDEKKRRTADEFCQQVLQLPTAVKQSDTFVQFFTSSAADSEESICRSGKKDSTSTDTRAVPSEQHSALIDDTSVVQYEEIGNFQAPLIASTTNETTVGPLATDATLVVYADVSKPGKAKPAAQPSLPVRTFVSKSPSADVQETAAYAEIPPSDITEETGLYSECKSPNVTSGMSSVITQSRPVSNEPLPTNVFTSNPNSDSSNSSSAALQANVSAGKNGLESEEQILPAHRDKAGLIPLTPIPPIPQTTPPSLAAPKDIPEDIGTLSDPSEILVIAIADFTSTVDNILSFNKGDMAALVIQSDTKWWCLKLGSTYGWVPADYWRMLNPDGECASLNLKSSAPWFVGKLSRSECEELLMQHGQSQHFVVRESTNLVGHFALSVKFNDRVHHFPIELTSDQRYYIGKHHFKTVNNVIAYYQKNALFYNENGVGVTLGSPLVIIKH
jgi:hypothetical protein